jgi:ribulose-bisphosphate carboxylase large chain
MSDYSLYRFPEAIATDEYVTATYYLETPMDIYQAAQALAAEQSTGTWRRVGKETDKLRDKFGAKVVGVYPIPGEVGKRSLPTSISMSEFGAESTEIKAAILQIAFPTIDFGAKLANLLSAVAGNVFEMGAFTAVKLMDLSFPKPFLERFSGPKFGIRGTRRIVQVENRPLVGAIIKPCVGLEADSLAELAYQGAKGGLDFIKDDELIADTEYNSLEERVKKVMAALKRAEEETGEKTLYAFNITDRVDKICQLHDVVVENGGKCVMLNVPTAGLSALRVLAEHTQVPIHCHRDFAAAFTRSPYLGINSTLLTKLFRLAGADQIHIGAVKGKLCETDDEALSDSRACLMNFPSISQALPVSSGGQWAGKALANYQKFGHVDFIHLSGAGIYSHPDGAEAGARSVRQAWEAVLSGISLEEYAKEHAELQSAINYFGSPA